jgi:CheY-like chemotaxis protein
MIDDDAMLAEIYRIALGLGGYRVVVAKDGPAGLEVAASAAPMLIFLDIRMPGMNGMDVLERLVDDETTRAIPVVMLSNYDDHDLVGRSLALGARQFIVKISISPGDLVAVVRRWAGPAA